MYKKPSYLFVSSSLMKSLKHSKRYKMQSCVISLKISSRRKKFDFRGLAQHKKIMTKIELANYTATCPQRNSCQ